MKCLGFRMSLESCIPNPMLLASLATIWSRRKSHSIGFRTLQPRSLENHARVGNADFKTLEREKVLEIDVGFMWFWWVDPCGILEETCTGIRKYSNRSWQRGQRT